MTLKNPFGDMEITEPQALRALAHPTRLAILERLQRHGPSTATQLSPHVGAIPSVVSWHLRHLARFGLVTDWDGAASRRERGWQAAATGYRFRPSNAEGRAAARQLETHRVARGADLVLRWLEHDEPRLPARWRTAWGLSNTGVCVTPAELDRIEKGIEAVLAPYVQRGHDHPPAGSRAVRLLRFVLPEADPDVEAGQVLFSMAYQTFYVSLVPLESYVEANSRLSMTRGASFVGGPAVGGALVQALTAPVAVLADVLSFLGSAVLVSRIRTQEPPPAPAGPSTLRLALDGMRLVLRRPLLRASLGCTATVNFFTFITAALLVLFASRELGLSAAAIGLAFGVGACGAVVGAAITPAVSRRLGAGRTATTGAAAFPLPLAAFALAGGSTWQRVAWLAGVEFLSGIGVMMDVNLNAMLTRAPPEGARGRGAGAYSAVNFGVRPLGALLGGLLGTAIGLRPSLGGRGAVRGARRGLARRLTGPAGARTRRRVPCGRLNHAGRRAPGG